MSGFIANNNTYNICTENEISVILSHFNPQYMFDVIRENISQRFRYNQLGMPNIVASFENYFKQLKVIYTGVEQLKEIEETRINTYMEIISILSNEFNFTFNQEEIQDYYSAAYYLYSFLVSDFSFNLVSFFSNFIIRERNSIYESFRLNDLKKNKDNSTIYNKKIYKNPKLAIINANLDYVIDNVCVLDISLYDILNNIYNDKNICKFLDTSIMMNQDFFKTVYVPIVQSDLLKPMILTDIRLNIQSQSISEDINILNLK